MQSPIQLNGRILYLFGHVLFNPFACIYGGMEKIDTELLRLHIKIDNEYEINT